MTQNTIEKDRSIAAHDANPAGNFDDAASANPLQKAASRQQMLQVNARQKEFYESRFEAYRTSGLGTESAANTATNLWTRMRSRLVDIRRALNLDDQIHDLHRRWLGDLSGARVLDLGCFDGNFLSLWIAETCADYTGLDLSEQAIAILNQHLRARNLPNARAYAQDFLANAYTDHHFDVIYAYSVLHHFQDLRVLLAELHRVLKPGGIIVSFDPLMTEPTNRLARALYRPMQSDRDWEWPFTRATLHQLRRYFEITQAQGFLGMARLGLPLYLLPGCKSAGQSVGRWGRRFDDAHANRVGPAFFFCWQAALQLRKPCPEIPENKPRA